jgi:zinc protease
MGRRIMIKLDVPQAAVSFGGPQCKPQRSGFMAAYIVSHILGGGSFSSHLYREVREKRAVRDFRPLSDSAKPDDRPHRSGADATSKTIEIIDRKLIGSPREGPTQGSS